MGYKLLTRDMKTRKDKSNEMDWSDIGKWHEATGSGGLCTNGVLHDYDDPWIAVVMNPAHADIGDPVMYETERSSDTISDGLKSGSKRMRLLGRIDLPDIPLLQKVAFGILSSLEVYFEERYVAWAMDWLSGKDRTIRSIAHSAISTTVAAQSAYAAAQSTYAAAETCAAAEAYAAAVEAYASARYAADAAEAYAAAVEAYASARYAAAQSSADYAARAVAVAAQSAYAAAKKIDWNRIKTEAMKIT